MTTQRISLEHRLEHRFARHVQLPTQWIRLRPAPHTASRVVAYSLRVHPEPHFLNWVRDAFENHLARLDLPEPVAALRVDVALVLDLHRANPFDFLVEREASTHPFEYPAALRKELRPYLGVPEAGPRLAAWLAALERTPCYVVDRVDGVNRLIHERVHATGSSPPGGAIDLERVLGEGRGSTWEVAWLLAVSLRALGLAARFVSGYRLRLPAGGGTIASASLDAWAETFLPGAGWVGLDPAAGLFTDDTWVPLACAPDPLRTAPLVGGDGGSSGDTHETVAARVLAPVPPTWPYEPAPWAEIGAVARGVDAALATAGVPLTVAREIALVSRVHDGTPEWTTAAVGPTKRGLADAYAAGLRRRLAPGGIVHLASGEWYAGEPAPRWRLACLWRADGVPLWPHAAPLDDGTGDRPPPTTMETAAVFSATLAHALGLPGDALQPAHEDPLHRLWSERTPCPSPSPDDLRDPERRAALAERLSASAPGVVAGWVLPLAWDAAAARWRTGRWRFRRPRLHLVAGTLPIGYRLPLPALPATPGVRPEDAEVPRTALCVEVRDGRLHVFVPPLDDAGCYLALVGAVATAAERHRLPVRLEGYEPPVDPRLRRIVLEPDGGVLRVGLPPAARWPEHVELLEAAYAEAEVLGLFPERRMADGTPERVGGATAVGLAGPTPDDSPWLRRPQLLGALVAYWQRHPSLSYCFATRAPGPGGVAPRADEGSVDALYELAIALERLPRGERAQPWLPDRLLRHLLVDRAGDVGRAEICMAQLYGPDDAADRLGHVALRGLETPPHPRLAAVHSLLLAAVVARLSHHPRIAAFHPWGAALHDRFLLPAVLEDDLRDVLADLADAGHPFRPEWFLPFLERWFPVLGRVQLGDQALELRLAHEPWPVLAEEATAHGMARFIDVATERVQVRASGLSPSRHVLVCNGRRVPLRGTGTQGEQAAGVRYKSWNPPATLHPTTPAIGELVLDLVDAWTGRVLGGCRWVPAHPSVVGPAAPAPPPPDGDGDGGPGVRRSPASAAPPWPRTGRFVAGGSGLERLVPPPPEPGDATVLDLTDPA